MGDDAVRYIFQRHKLLKGGIDMATTAAKRAETRHTNDGGTTMAEEVEVTVKEVEDTAAKAGGSLFEGLRKVLLASLGAIAMSRDEVEVFVGKLVERGELAQKD